MPGEPKNYQIQDAQLDADGMPPLFDPGNGLLMTVAPSFMQTGTQALPDGSMTGILTIRTGTTTLTLPLDKGQVAGWIDSLQALHDALAGSGIQVISRRGLIAGKG